MPREVLGVREGSTGQIRSGRGVCGTCKINLRDIVELAVALSFRVPPPELRAPTRSRAAVAFARQVAMYLMHVACGLSLTEVGALFGRDRTTVAHACGLVEDRRDDPSFDRFLDNLEIAIVKLTRASFALRPSQT